ncbi:MAG: hypothetical protein AAF849_01730 [Bacteroidota bacterium]
MKRINFWSSPRNISTALMYAFAQRDDCSVVDEPLYAHYLLHIETTAIHPATQEILASMEQDGEQVIQTMLQKDFKTPNVLFKQMTHHLMALDWSFLAKMENVLLIRDPRLIIHSYAKVIPNPSMQDVGVRQQFELMQHLLKISKLNAVVDANILLRNPKNILKKLCECLQIPFQSAMLNWKAGKRAEDGIWAKYWYKNVHQSTGFQPYQEKEIHLSDELEELAEACLPYYEALLEQVIK